MRSLKDSLICLGTRFNGESGHYLFAESFLGSLALDIVQESGLYAASLSFSLSVGPEAYDPNQSSRTNKNVSRQSAILAQTGRGLGPRPPWRAWSQSPARLEGLGMGPYHPPHPASLSDPSPPHVLRFADPIPTANILHPRFHPCFTGPPDVFLTGHVRPADRESKPWGVHQPQ